MLIECNYNANLLSDMNRGRMPSADKLTTIAQYLCISTDYLMGVTDDPTPPKKELTREEKLLAEIYKLTPEKFKTAEEFIGFLKTQQEFSQEFAESLDINTMKPQSE